MNIPENTVRLKPHCHFHFFYMVFKLMFNSPRVVASQSKPKRAQSEMQSCLPNMAQKRQGGSFKQGGRERDRMQGLLRTYRLYNILYTAQGKAEQQDEFNCPWHQKFQLAFPTNTCPSVSALQKHVQYVKRKKTVQAWDATHEVAECTLAQKSP